MKRPRWLRFKSDRRRNHRARQNTNTRRMQRRLKDRSNGESRCPKCGLDSSITFTGDDYYIYAACSVCDYAEVVGEKGSYGSAHTNDDKGAGEVDG